MTQIKLQSNLPKRVKRSMAESGGLNALVHRPQPPTTTVSARFYWGDINLALSASTINPGVEVKGACKGYQSYCIDVYRFKRGHVEIPGKPARMGTWSCARAQTQCLA